MPVNGVAGSQTLMSMFEKLMEKERKSGADVEDGVDRDEVVEYLKKNLETSELAIQVPGKFRVWGLGFIVINSKP